MSPAKYRWICQYCRKTSNFMMLAEFLPVSILWVRHEWRHISNNILQIDVFTFKFDCVRLSTWFYTFCANIAENAQYRQILHQKTRKGVLFFGREQIVKERSMINYYRLLIVFENHCTLILCFSQTN